MSRVSQVVTKDHRTTTTKFEHSLRLKDDGEFEVATDSSRTCHKATSAVWGVCFMA